MSCYSWYSHVSGSFVEIGRPFANSEDERVLEFLHTTYHTLYDNLRAEGLSAWESFKRCLRKELKDAETDPSIYGNDIDGPLVLKRLQDLKASLSEADEGEKSAGGFGAGGGAAGGNMSGRDDIERVEIPGGVSKFLNPSGFLVERCEMCGGRIARIHVPDVGVALLSLANNIPFPTFWKFSNGVPYLHNQHLCADGRRGITTVIGAIPDDFTG